MSSTDVETFNGKIVYNLDGSSAYIIDADNANDNGSGETSKFRRATASISVKDFSNAKDFGFVEAKDTKKHQQQEQEQEQEQEQQHQQQEQEQEKEQEKEQETLYKSSPKIHSFRVVTAQDANSNPTRDIIFKIQKPILMCFICKLSFGNVKSFSLHANTEHKLNLIELEQQLLKREYSSAIIQRNMDEKPSISFLQPLDINATGDVADEKNLQQMSTDAVAPIPTEADQQEKENENENENDSFDQCGEREPQNDPEDDQGSDHTSNNQMAAPSAYYHHHQVKSSVKFGSLNSETETTKTNKLSKVSVPSSSSSTSSGEVSSLPRTDNLSNNNSKSAESSLEIEMNPGSSSPPQRNELPEAPSSDFLAATAPGIFPPQVSSFHASLAALAANNTESNGNRVKLITEFLQQQLQQHQHQQQQQQQHQSSLFPSQCLEHPDLNGVDCKSCEFFDIQGRTKSPSLPQHQAPPHRSPCSNLAMSPSSSSVTSVGNAGAMGAGAAAGATSSFTIGACSDHINGRPQGVDCARCEMLLNSARLNSGVQMSTRNSCKTLKCPQCNWHYKYQETLEIHMREKHPDGESACGYCLAGQQHPRLARGESYSCGYKPYRCEICNYSTTTKGNLSIHMQSDKHLNNMQELNSSQNMVAAAVATGKLLLSSSSSSPQGAGSSNSAPPPVGASSCLTSNSVVGNPSISNNSNASSSTVASSSSNVNLKPKPSFRCDICSYETSVARNLRIHMTSEKHTHNMAVLQNNIKHIQTFNFLQQQQQQSSVSGAVSSSGVAGSFLPEVALADLAYNQALMIQLLHHQQQQQQQQQQQSSANTKLSPTSSSPDPFNFSISPKPVVKMAHNQGLGLGMGMPMVGGMMESGADSAGDLSQPISKPNEWPSALYSCLICDAFNTNNLDDLNQHLLVDRSRSQSTASSCSVEIMLIHNNNYICRLCNYKTNLKANFQLHSKTDKHLQKLSYINHIKEGGIRNEYKFQQHFQQQHTNVVQLKCNCCDFNTNSIQKLSLHSQQMRHDTMRMIFQHLLYIVQQSNLRKGDNDSCPDEEQSSKKHLVLLCQLCNFTAKNLHEMVQHVKSMRHMQVEQFVCLQRRSENKEIPALNDVFKVTEWIYDNEGTTTTAANEGSSLDATSCADAAPTASLSSAAAEASSSSSSAAVAGADVGIFSPTTTSPSSCSTSCGKTLGIGVTSPTPTVNDFGLVLSAPPPAPAPASVSVSAVSVPTTVFKCNLCEYFVQSKSEMETHIEAEHPCADPSEDFISIPTNTAALQAFQTAVAAAAIAAARQQRVNVIDAVTDIKREEEDDEEVEEVSKSTEVSEGAEKKVPAGIQCPLCLENHFREKTSLEMHLTSVHNVARDGLSRLLMLIDPKAWEDTKSSNISAEEAPPAPEECSSSSNSAAATTSGIGMNVLCCQKCEASFKHDEQLLQHAQQTQHFPVQNGEYLCLGLTHPSRPCYLRFRTLTIMINHYQDTHMSSVISERHVYKYRCKQCSLAFKTQEKLTTHMLYHSMRDATKCSHCQRNFRSTQALQKHMEQVHAGGDGVRSNSSPQAQAQSAPSSELPAEEAFAAMSSPLRFENPQLVAKETNSNRQSPIASMSDAQTQHQYLATLTNLLKQQQCNSEVLGMQPDALLPMGEFSQHLQNQQNLQTLQQQQQQQPFGTAINPVDMLNIMQFHHLMSLNFMNLAPPLVFGGSGGVGVGGGGGGGGVVAGATHQINSNLNACSSSADIQLANSGDSGKAPAAVPTLTQHNVANSSSQLTASNQKRARTRITDDQLKILRAHFDINNSPSEESIMEMSQKANLPMKVVKHWFRNTLFKERQRNKDSPYNFNNPPSTTLNLEEYERTGQAKVTPLNDMGSGGSGVAIALATPSTTPIPSSSVTLGSSFKEAPTNATRTASVSMSLPIPASSSVSRPESTNSSGNISDYLSQNLWGKEPGKDQNHTPPFSTEMHIKSEPQEIDNNDFGYQKQQQNINFMKHQQPEQTIKNTEIDTLIDQTLHSTNFPQQQTHLTNHFETKSESGSSDVMSRPPTPNPVGGNNLYGNMNDLINQQLMETMGPPIKKLQISGKTMEKSLTTTASSSTTTTINQSSCSQFESNNSSNSSSSSSTSGGKRANRTRFTDYQIKVLQEFFENNSYPKDSDLEYLSKLLLLSPRVIVVWFQNARQKQRKIYENQPNNTLFENEETKKQNINYACKKCSLVFQRYYELIRHQKNHCFKEENNKKSAKAQIAAAQIAQNLSSEDSMDSSMDVHHQNMTAQLAPVPSPHHNFFTKSSSSLHDFSPSTTPTPPQQAVRERSNSLDLPQSQQRHAKCYDCDKCELQFSHLEKLREHQLLHLMNPIKSNLDPSFGPFGNILQSLQQAAAQTQSQLQQQPEVQSESQNQLPPAKKRKISNDSFSSQAEDDHAMVLEKKHEFLQKYFLQNETNAELKKQFLMQQQHNKQSNESSDFELEFLTNFYQQNELKKVSNYDFLLQYYRNQEEKSSTNFSSSQSPTIEFLLQYYQLNESKKFFQLVASPQRVPDDGPGGNFQPLAGKMEDEPAIKEVHKEEPQEQHDEVNADGKDLEKELEKDWKHEEKLNNNNDAGENLLESASRSRSLQTLQNDEKDKSQYLHNLEDFLDATMIENNSQTLTFNDDNENNASQKDESAVKANELEKRSSVSPVNVSSSKQNKRLRTTILPEQLNFLYECYQSESNPSRKMLEEISKKVNLKKRVVQVWFQNSRAKDKKSRNQRHYAHISDDNSYDDGGSSSKDNAGQENNEITSLLQDCQLCQVTQVNLQKHAFSVEHIGKMKKFLEQTTSELYGSDDSDSDREKHFYNLSKAFLLQHVVSSAAKSNSAANNTGNSGQDSQPEDENCLLNYDVKGEDAKIPDVRVTEASNQDLMQKLFNRNHITGK
ncbi:hypothetical protein KR038_010257, partial [Drosophila bunnanda]